MAGISRPEKELNTFKEVVLSSGERKDVGVIVAEDDLKFAIESVFPAVLK